jgi:hypothetical protein
MKSEPLTYDASSEATSCQYICKSSKLTEDNSLGLLNSLAEAAHGVVDETAVELLGGVEEVHEEGGADGAAVGSARC